MLTEGIPEGILGKALARVSKKSVWLLRIFEGISEKLHGIIFKDFPCLSSGRSGDIRCNRWENFRRFFIICEFKLI